MEEQDFELARKELTPSVSYEELKHYEKVRDQFEGGAKKETVGSEEDGQEMQAVVSAASANKKTQMSESDKAFAREKFNELMARRTSSKNAVPQMNGRGEDGGASSGDDDGGDDDYVVRTDRLTLNGSHANSGGRASSRPVGGKGKGKGKGKSRDEAVVDEPEDGGEDLYD